MPVGQEAISPDPRIYFVNNEKVIYCISEKFVYLLNATYTPKNHIT